MYKRGLQLGVGFLVLSTIGFVLNSSSAKTPVAESQVASSVVNLSGEGLSEVVDKVGAKSFYVIDIETGQKLFSHQEDEVLPIASVTKLFSSAVFYRDDLLNKEYQMTQVDVDAYGEAGGFSSGDSVTAISLIASALLESSNDAAVAQGRVSDMDLLLSMNALARRYDAVDTYFADTSGLSDDNVSTAEDLATLLRGVYFEFPHVLDITKLSKYVNETDIRVNNNPLHEQGGYGGGKHGYTEAAGRTVVAIFTEADKREVGYVVLGSEDIVSDVQYLRLAYKSNLEYQE